MSDFLPRFHAAVAVDSDSECWVWQRRLDADGYGEIRVNGRKVKAHRASYEHYVAQIPAGLVLDHLCRNRACVNPLHVEPVTDEENRRRGFGAAAMVARTGECVNGHAYTPENTYRRPTGRQCRACAADRMRRTRLERAS